MILPAVSLWQPHASLLFTPAGAPAKVHETRNYGAPEKYVGRRIVIHAAVQPMVKHKIHPRLRDLCETLFGDDFANTLPRGAYIGTIVLEESQVMSTRRGFAVPANETDEICGWWEDGRHAWRMSQGRLLPEPIPWRGLQGWWTAELPDDALAA